MIPPHPNPDSPSPALDRVLHALRDTPVPAGLEQRLHTSLHAPLQAAASTSPAASARRLLRFPTLPPKRFYAAAALAAAALVVATIALHPGRQSAARPAGLAAPAPIASAKTEAPPPPAVPLARVPSSPATLSHTKRTAPPVPSASALTLRAAADASPFPSSPAEADRLAREETDAPSRPAPTLPLSPQQRAFLHLVRHPDLVQLAELTPAFREARLARDEAEFQRFFPPPPPPPDPASGPTPDPTSSPAATATPSPAATPQGDSRDQ